MIYKSIEVLEEQKFGPLRFGVCQYGFRLKNNSDMINSNWFHYLSDVKNCECKRVSN